jgi:glycosyltransferase involved in cell wall biosynthesis
MSIDNVHKSEDRRHVSGVRYSIIITCYNQLEFIEGAVKSALSQVHVSKEVIVVDDGSQDGSLELLRRYQGSVDLLALTTNHGVSEARNRGAAIASGEYLIFLDGDDLFTPWALEVYERLITERHPITIVSGALWFEGSAPFCPIDDAPKRLEFVEYESLMAKDRVSGIYTGAFVINRLAFQDVGGWSPGIWHLDGQDLYAKLAYSGYSILILSPYTMLYRMHATNCIRSVRPYARAAHLMMDRERDGQYPGGPRRQFERNARHGGVICFCIKRLLRVGLYNDALRLAARGWPMIQAAIISRSLVRLRGRRPVRTLELKSQESGCHVTVA